MILRKSYHTSVEDFNNMLLENAKANREDWIKLYHRLLAILDTDSFKYVKGHIPRNYAPTSYEKVEY